MGSRKLGTLQILGSLVGSLWPTLVATLAILEVGLADENVLAKMDQLCEVCGLVVWRMQAALAAETGESYPLVGGGVSIKPTLALRAAIGSATTTYLHL